MATLDDLVVPLSFQGLTIAHLKSVAGWGNVPVSWTIGTRFSTSFKTGQTFPAAKVQLVDGFEKVRGWLTEAVIQVDVYGRLNSDTGAPQNADHESEAELLGRLVQWAMLRMPGMDHSRGIVTDVSTRRIPGPLPDDLYTPSRPRYSADYAITAHPHPPS